MPDELTMASSDTVDHLILTEMCGGLTLQEIETPPTRVLDLGCGGGMWILAAAKEWPVSCLSNFQACRH